MPNGSSQTCPTCASPNTFVVAEKGVGRDRQVQHECVCGERWWTPEPIAPKQHHLYSYETPSSIEPWIDRLEQNMRDLQSDPNRLYALTKPGF